jgi:putative FmdB family regulatory protein
MCPIYEFECSACEEKTEVIFKNGAIFSTPKCPVHNKNMDRVVSSGFFDLKGNDWSKRGMQ